MSVHRIGGFASMLEAARHASMVPHCGHGLAVWDSHGQRTAEIAYADVWPRTQQFAANLHVALAPQVSHGHKLVGVIAATHIDFLPAFLACQSMGLVPCPIAPPHGLEASTDQSAHIQNLLSRIGACALLGPQEWLSVIGPIHTGQDQVPGVSFERLASPHAGLAPVVHEPQPHELAYVQFSSGTTGAPKGFGISHAALMASVDTTLRNGLHVQAADRAFSWLPYYHDMGLVGFVLAPLCAQVGVDYLQPSAFARRPWAWLELMTHCGSSITYAPSFAWRRAAEVDTQRLAAVDLTALRVAGVGGDLVRAADLQAFATRMQPVGFNPDAFKPSYGMAEATLAVSIAEGTFWSLTRCPASAPDEPWVHAGKPLPGWRVEVRDAQAQPVPPGEPGAICLQGAALATTVLEAGHSAPLPLEAGYYNTGDVGFVDTDGCIVITGREKDCIQLRGRNIWPLRVEAQLLDAHPDLDNAMLMQPWNDERLVLLAQWRKPPSDGASTDLASHARALTGAQVTTLDVPRLTITRTSSGKKIRHGRVLELARNALH